MMDLVDTVPWDAPYFEAFCICLGFVALTWLLSVLTREYSWTDRVWSISPAVFSIYVAGSADFEDLRLNVMALLVTLWGARLTFNFARKGGYWKGGEDYRWGILKERMTPFQFQLFNISFIAAYQNVLVFLMVAPMHEAWTHREAAFGTIDVVATCLFALFVLFETIADEQMWRFQQDKKARLARGEPITRPFFDRGLYAFSRHPNYFCEISMWWTFYLFSVGASGRWANWTVIGAALLHLLFLGSTKFGESISRSRYPEYATYQARVSRLIPWWPGR